MIDRTITTLCAYYVNDNDVFQFGSYQMNGLFEYCKISKE